MKTTLENNKMIAEFMGGKFIPATERSIEGFQFDDKNLKGFFHTITGNGTTNPLRYDTSWDWLMPVVEKIEFTDNGVYDVNILQDGTIITDWTEQKNIIEYTASFYDIPNKITGVYMAVVQFIQWYNENK